MWYLSKCGGAAGWGIELPVDLTFPSVSYNFNPAMGNSLVCARQALPMTDQTPCGSCHKSRFRYFVVGYLYSAIGSIYVFFTQKPKLIPLQPLTHAPATKKGSCNGIIFGLRVTSLAVDAKLLIYKRCRGLSSLALYSWLRIQGMLRSGSDIISQNKCSRERYCKSSTS